MSFSLHPQLENDTFFLADLPLCRVLLMNDARYPWLILVPRRDKMREIMDLLRSLGRNEMPFGTIRIDRVSTQTSYETVEEGAAASGNTPFKPGAIELRKLLAAGGKAQDDKESLAQTAPSATASRDTAKPTRKAERQASESGANTAPQPKTQQKDEKW